jgi:NADP-reducing hydrogenase subunit HndC
VSRGAQDVVTEVAWEVERHGLVDDVVQTECGCVAPLCGRGPVVLSYPAGAWYAGVRPEDVPEIVAEDLAAGRPVERLLALRLAATDGAAR